MRRTTIIAVCIILAVSGAYLAIRAEGTEGTNGSQQGNSESFDITITGKLSCTSCTVAEPNMVCSPGCCVNCIETGDPPLLTDIFGRMFILIAGEKESPLMTEERKQLLGKEVTVKGLLVRQGGNQAIYVDDIQSTEPKVVSVTGKLSCTFCTLADPNMGCPPGCCVNCVSSGDPTTLTDASGNIYVLLSGEKGMPLMTLERIEMVGKSAKVDGLLVNRNGIQVIYVDAMTGIEE